MAQFIEMPDGEYVPLDLYNKYKFVTLTLFPKKFLLFEEARKFARKLKLKNQKEWRKYSKSGNRSNNIPSAPNQYYKDKWISWGNFLGTGNVYKKDFLSFTKARIFVKKLKLSNVKEWKEYCKSGKKSNNIPHNPNIVYKDKWNGWGNFLGTGNIASYNKIFLSFERARDFVRNLKLRNMREWQKYSKSNNKPDNIPAAPNTVYRDKWTSWGDFLGTGNVHKKDFISFAKARIFARKLKLKNLKEWRKYCTSENKPDNIPSTPNKIYKDKWTSWGNFLGTGNMASNNKIFLSFEEARDFVRKLKLRNKNEWEKYCKLNKKSYNIPYSPNKTYKDEWTNWYDFLGTK